MFRSAHLALVIAGGAVGTAARAALTLAVGAGEVPFLIPVLNVVGALALGILVGVLARGALTPRRRAAQQLFGTGLLGGFTTYSALAVEASDPAFLWLDLASILVGTAAAWAGLVLGRGRRRAA